MKNRSQLFLLTSLMGLSLAGIVLVQGYWVRSSVRLKEQHFAQSVNAALNRAVMQQESSEKLFWIKKEVGEAESVKRIVVINGDTLESSEIPSGLRMPDLKNLHTPNDSGLESVAAERIVINSSKANPHQRRVVMQIEESASVISTNEDSIDHKMQVTVLPQEELLQDILVQLAKDPRPVRERVDSADLQTVLTEALRQQDIAEPFRFAVVDSAGKGIVLPLVPKELLPETHSSYSVKLFPGSIRSDPSLLLVDFPQHQSPISQVLGIVLPTTGVLILIIAGVFAFTVSAWRKQKRLSDIKTDFINNMTHELKTPVATISLATEALSDPDMMKSAEDVDRYTRMIREENERLRQHIERALQNARLEKGQLSLAPESLALSGILHAQADRISQRVESRGGQVIISGESNLHVLADPRYLADILFNLLDNAEKYSPDAPMIRVECREEKNNVLILISDQGTGIPAEHQSRIFEQFYRVPAGNLHDVKGTGLGLSYARSLARLMGGDITVKSESGKGATFTLMLLSVGKGKVI